jgi:hypothetical protein
MEIHLDFTYIPAWLISVLCVMWTLNAAMGIVNKLLRIRLKKKALKALEEK